MAKRAYIGVSVISNPGPFSSTTSWNANQNVTISVSNGALRVVSAQSSSTPGVWTALTSAIPANTQVTLTYKIRGNVKVNSAFYGASSTSTSFGDDYKMLTDSFQTFTVSGTATEALSKFYFFMVNPTTSSWFEVSEINLSYGIARRIKKGYIGVVTDVPVYQSQTINVTKSNVADVFTVSNGAYYFSWDTTGYCLSSMNDGIDDSTATVTLTAKSDISNVSFSYNVSSESGWDKLTIKVNGTVIVNGISGEQSGTWSGALPKDKKIEVSYAKDSSNSSGNDTGSIYNIVATTTVQTGTERKSVARRIRKAYIGVGGVARPFWGTGEVTIYGNINKLSNTAMYRMAAGNNKNYAIFAGGTTGYGYYYDTQYPVVTDMVETYNSALTKGTATSLYQKVQKACCISVGDYAVVAGGEYPKFDSSGTSYYGYEIANTTASVYNGSMTRSTVSCSARDEAYGASASNFAITFATGASPKGTGIECFNSSLTRTFGSYEDVDMWCTVAIGFGEYVIICPGGYVDGDGVDCSYDYVCAYNSSLTQVSSIRIPGTGLMLPGLSKVGNYALIGGSYNGVAGGVSSSSVYAINKSLTRSTAPEMAGVGSGTTGSDTGGTYVIGDSDTPYYLPEHAILFGGGVNVYDASLTRTTRSDFKKTTAHAMLNNYLIQFQTGTSSYTKVIAEM